MRASIVVTALAGTLGCGGAEVFACRQSADCAGREGGVCEPDGWCSFPDDGCASGRRYGRWVGDDLAQTCVPADVADTGSSTHASAETTGGVGTTTTLGPEVSSDPATTVAPTDATGSSSLDPSSGNAEASSSTGVPDDAPVAWYRFEDDGFAGTVLDSANGHDGTCEMTACPTSTPGIVGNAALFDGVDDIVRVDDHVDFATDTGFTLAAWVRLDGDQTGFRCFVAKPLDDVGNYDSWELGRDENARTTANIQLAEQMSVTVAGEILPVGDWVHVASTWDGASLRLWVDGLEVDSTDADSILLTGHALYFAGSWDGGEPSNFLLGALDELQIWRRALDGDEIAMLATP